jgi:mRNA-degrading endonuclease toxin of MazEF toxin-antitoxin module
MTTNLARAQYPQNALIKGGAAVPVDSVALGEQLTVVAKSRLQRYRGELNSVDTADVDRALRTILAL